MTMDRAEAEEALALIRRVVNQVHDDTILQNRGKVMVIVAILDLIIFAITQYLATAAVYRLLPYAVAWGIYLVLALAANLSARTQMGGTMTYVERHVWGNGLTFYTASFAIAALDCWFMKPAQALAVIPAHLAVIGAVSFAFMTLVDLRFFLYTAIFFAVAALLGLWPEYGFALLGIAWFFCLAIPGLQYTSERKRLLAAGQKTEIV
jgi:hypothetical protein